MKRENENGEDKEENKRVRHNHNGDNIDRLSYLPDWVLIQILSSLKIEDAVRTCILSSTWQHLWKHLPILTLKSSDFSTVEGFNNFVKGILSRRRRHFSMVLNTLDLQLGYLRDSPFSVVYADREFQESIRHVIRYVASQNVNRLRLSLGNCGGILPFPYFLLSSASVTSLDIEFENSSIIFPNSLNLPALTYLKLRNLCFYSNTCIDPFSTYKSLNTLILYQCNVLDTKPLCISSSTLVNLSIHVPEHTHCDWGIQLFAPSLCTFDITCSSFQRLSGSHLSSIKQFKIHIFRDNLSVFAPLNLDLLNWLVEMTSIESLIVDTITLWLLSSVREELKVKSPSLHNLKSLKVVNRYPKRDVSYVPAAGTMPWKENTKLQEAIQARLQEATRARLERERYSFIPCGVIDILLQNSPSAVVDILI